MDRFPTEVSAEQLTCATGQVEVANVSVDAALPFASMFAGLLIAADLVRAQLPDYPQIPNFALFDWYGPFHEQFNAASKYRKVFGFDRRASA